MRLRNWFVCSLAVLALGCGTVLAQEEPAPKKPKKAKPKRPGKPPAKKPPAYLRGEWSRVAKELKLTEGQEKQLADALKAHQAAVKEWEQANAAKLKELQDQSKKLRDQMQGLSKERQNLRDAERIKILDVLSDEQKPPWVRYQLRSSVMGRLRGVKLTAEQAKNVEDLLAASAQKVSAMAGEQQKEGLAKETDGLKKALDGMVTAEQTRQAQAEALAGRVLSQVRRAKLTEDQVAKVKALAAEAVAGLAQTAERIDALNKEMNELRKKLRGGGADELLDKVKQTVLSAEQRSQLTPPPKKKKPAAPKKKTST